MCAARENAAPRRDAAMVVFAAFVTAGYLSVFADIRAATRREHYRVQISITITLVSRFCPDVCYFRDVDFRPAPPSSADVRHGLRQTPTLIDTLIFHMMKS